MKKKLKVVVLMGGKSSEHEVSILSGINVISALDSNKYEVLPVVISKNGKDWKLTSKNALLNLNDPLKLRGTLKEIILSQQKEIVGGVGSFSASDVDVFFIAMHGKNGEDGAMQGMLELTGIPYTSSGVLASAVGMDKFIFRKLMATEKLPIPKYWVIEKGQKIALRLFHKFPYFVKPSDQGSSVGAAIAKNKKSLLKAIRNAFNYSDKVLVDEYIKGIELTCTVMGNKKLITLPIVEIRPLKGEFFDYESKYTESGSEEIVPARISKELAKKIQEISLHVYKVLNCRGFARVDFILKNKKTPVILEINTIPGLTPASLAPKAAKAAGMSYSEFLDKIINYAIEI